MLAYWNSRSHPALQNIPYPEATSYDFASVASISVKCYKTAEGYEDTLHYSLSLRVCRYSHSSVVCTTSQVHSEGYS